MLFGDDGVKEGYPVGSEIEGALWAKIATLKAIYSAKFHANSRQAMKIMARTLLHLEGYYSAATKGSISLNLIKVIHFVCGRKSWELQSVKSWYIKSSKKLVPPSQKKKEKNRKLLVNLSSLEHMFRPVLCFPETLQLDRAVCRDGFWPIHLDFKDFKHFAVDENPLA